MNVPADLKYGRTHEWARVEGDVVVVGISHYAQDQLGEVVYVEVPDVGFDATAAEELGTLESVKAVSELYMPVGGEITAINEALEDEPELVNNDPYGGGWMIDIKAGNPAEIDDLKPKADYLEMLKG